MRTASATSTPPITQRCAAIHAGFRANQRAMAAAVVIIQTSNRMLMTICTPPSVTDCSSTDPRAGSMNCGNSAR